MARGNGRLRGRRRKKREPYTLERYSTRALHEEREYGLFWYAWLWKILRPVLIFFCSVLIVVGMVTVGYNKVYGMFLAPTELSWRSGARGNRRKRLTRGWRKD